MADQIRRPINYYGSKERVAPQIHAMIPENSDTWVDVCCGSAIVTLSKPRHLREVVNDLNGDVVNLFRVIRDPALAPRLYELVELTPYAEEELQDVYQARPAEDPVQRALAFLVASWFGRGGDAHKTGFRWSKGQNTAPERTWSTLPARLARVADRLRGVCIRSDDALKIIGDYDAPGCVLYYDPPYLGDVGRRYAVKMTKDQHCAIARRLATCRADVIVSMLPGTLYDQELAGWHRHPITVMGGRSAKKTELLLTNFTPRNNYQPSFLAAE